MASKPLVWAHRGASAHAPENTMYAFALAPEMGADGIELDVQMSADGELVVIHDEKLERTTSGEGWVYETEWAELRELTASAGMGDFPDARIPLLAEVLDFSRSVGLWVNIELKDSIVVYPGMGDKVVHLVEQLGMSEQVIVSSFNHQSLRSLAPTGLPLGVLYVEHMIEPWRYARTIGDVRALHPFHRTVTAEVVENCVSEGIDVNTWTVDDPDDQVRLAEMGVTGIMANDPEAASQNLR